MDSESGYRPTKCDACEKAGDSSTLKQISISKVKKGTIKPVMKFKMRASDLKKIQKIIVFDNMRLSSSYFSTLRHESDDLDEMCQDNELYFISLCPECYDKCKQENRIKIKHTNLCKTKSNDYLDVECEWINSTHIKSMLETMRQSIISSMHH